MPSSIASCPSCEATLLEETVQCPDCDHVLDQSRFDQLSDQAAVFAQGAAFRDQKSCPTCGEMVRHRMVRCWNCGSFMRKDMAAIYQQMQSRPTPVIYSEPTSGDDPIYQFEETPASTDHDEDDFELSN